MTKRLSRESAKDRKASEDMGSDDGKPPDKKKGRYNLRGKRGDHTTWVDDDTLDKSPTPEKEDPALLPKVVPVTMEGEEDDEEDSDYDDDEEEEEELDDSDYEDNDTDEDEFISYLANKFINAEPNRSPFPPEASSRPSRKSTELVPIKLTRQEEAYFKSQPKAARKELLELMTRVSSLVLDEGEVPYKFQVLKMPIPDHTKSNVIKKIGALAEMCDSGESYKLKNWVDAFMRIPFGKIVPLPVQIMDGQQKCTDFMVNARAEMDKAIYGMVPAKTQIMQIIAQLIVNPESVGNVIVLNGPPGIGKTSFAKHAIASVLKRPFEFFSLGGASDISNFVGHSYTYEGSMWGRIADCLMHSKVMNPVMYFDELDKVSTTPHGEEIISMLIHLTDRSQNTQFHDRYFSGVDFDLSQCLFVFSLNDINLVHPILRDRMTVIQCGSYNEIDKKSILKEYVWNSLLDRLRFHRDDVILRDDAIKYLITEYSKDEKGVRTLLRTVESMMTRLNMLRVANHESMKDYKFYMEVKLPLTITEEVVKTLMCDMDKKEPETWRSLYN